MRATAAGIALLVVVVAASWLAVAGIGAPDPAPPSAPAEDFSAARALEHVRALASAPRPVGTEAHAEAREYVVDRLEELGLDARVQAAVGRSRGGRVFGTVHNVLARLPGSDGEHSAPAVLLVAHYDSVPSGPGASDDAAGVAVLLETLRALQAGPPPGHDVIALFTDAEEAGLLGADAFAHEHPWMDDVAVVLNFEARGTRGPAVMFETGSNNLWTIRRLAAAAPHPVAASYSYEVYRRLPNDTDFSVFRARGLGGLNFAHIHGAVGYHTAKDSIERLDPASVQHHGETALALTRELAGAELGAVAQARGDAVYFNPWGSLFVWFPARWVVPLLGVLAVAALVVVALAVRRRRPGAAGLLAGIGFWLTALAVTGVLGALLRGVVFPVPYDFRIWGDGSSFAWGLFGWTLFAIGLVVGLYGLGRRWISAAGLAAGGLLVWLVVSVIASLAAPGASYLFLIPLAAQGIAFGGLVLGAPDPAEGRTDAGPDRVRPGLWLLLALAAVVTVLVWAPTLALVAVGLQLGGLLPLGVLAALLLALLALQVEVVTASRLRAAVPVALLLTGVALVMAVRAAGGFAADSPRPTSLLYALDADEERAVWASFERRLSPWSGGMLPDEPERRPLAEFVGHDGELATGPAPVLDLESPAVEVMERPPPGEAGTFRLRVMPPAGAHRLRLQLEPAASIRGVTVAGREAELPSGRERIDLVYVAPRPEGVEVVVETAAGPAPELAVVAQWFRLPSENEGGPPARGAGLMQTGLGWDSDSILVRARLPLEGGSSGAPPAAETVSPASDIR